MPAWNSISVGACLYSTDAARNDAQFWRQRKGTTLGNPDSTLAPFSTSFRSTAAPPALERAWRAPDQWPERQVTGERDVLGLQHLACLAQGKHVAFGLPQDRSSSEVDDARTDPRHPRHHQHRRHRVGVGHLEQSRTAHGIDELDLTR